MPSVKSESPKKSASTTGDWQSLTITKAANGFEIRKSLPPKTSKGGMTSWQPDPPAYLCTGPGECLDYLEECVGSKEHEAHESEEEAGEKGEKE